jgi:putative adenylate-forming enzyme
VVECGGLENRCSPSGEPGVRIPLSPQSLFNEITMNNRFSLRVFDRLETKSFLLFYLLCKYRFRYFSRKEIINYQEKRIKNVVKSAVANSEFFRDYYSGHDLNDIWNLPVINKKIMMDNLSGYNTVGLSKDEIINFCLEVEKTRDFTKRLNGLNIGMSSGTSGNKGVEIVTLEEENYMRAALFARFDFPKKERINLAFILRVSSPAFSLGKFGHKLTYISQYETIETIISRLEKLNPNVISAPPSMLKILANEYEKGKLSVNPVRLISYAEVLYPDVKKYFEQLFKCPVHQIYKCTEGPIGISCRQGSLHINEDLVAVQTLDDDGNPVPDGHPCKRLIITDLHKKSQPIIRYELNDIITISKEKCRCGSEFRVIEEIKGRADDLFWGIRKDDKTKHFIYQDYIVRMIITASDDIDDFQAIQQDYTHITLRIRMKKNADNQISQKLINGIKEIFSHYQCIEPEVEIVFGDPLSNQFSNKLSRVICLIKQI